LRVLYLDTNNIGEKGIKELVAGVNHNQMLTKLSLRNIKNYMLGSNRIGDKGAEALAIMLRDNNTLTSLNLS